MISLWREIYGWPIWKWITYFSGCMAIGLVLGGTLGAFADDEDPTKYHLKPEVRITIEQSDRIELYAGGLHVGTIIFDQYGYAMFVGDASQVKGVIAELMAFLNMISSNNERQQEKMCYNAQKHEMEPCPSA